MLVPIYLGLCRADPDRGHQAAAALIGGNLGTALAVSLVHAAAMIAAGGLAALAVHAWLGLSVLPKAWLNLDAAWALSLVAVGAVALAMAVAPL